MWMSTCSIQPYLKWFRSESRFEAFKILIQVLPSVGKAIEDPATDMDIYLTQVYPGSRLVCYICPHLFICSLQLQKGANDARSDDVRRIKEELALWLNIANAPNPPLNTKCRSDRGMDNDITGRLLCPIEYDWDDETSV